MLKTAILTVAACATLLWAGIALATVTPKQHCDNARITAWKKYVSCVDSAVAKDAKGVIFDEFAAFAKCRHAYFKKWTAFQPKASFAGSTCIGLRFTNNGTTVTDNLTGLVWEKKTNLDVNTNFGDPHDADNPYTWSTGSNNEDGEAFTTFLTQLNGSGFAGANGWRLPTRAELQSIVLDFACTGAGGGATCSCSSSPCIDGTFDATNTQSTGYWSATSDVPDPVTAWTVYFNSGWVGPDDKLTEYYVRAVRGGL